MLINELIDLKTGERKYLNAQEREAFKDAAGYMEPDIRTFCLMIYYTGCRPSEAREICPDRLDFDERYVLIRTLKQNPDKKDKYRFNELPSDYLASLESEYKARSRKGTKTGKRPLWSFSERTGRNYISRVMAEAGITGKKATARGLRHSVGVMLAINKTPANVIQKVLGHTAPKNTMIYMEILGEDRRGLVSQIW